MLRRDILKTTATLIGGTALGDLNPGTLLAAETPVKGGTLIWGHSETTQNLDIHQTGAASTVRVLQNVHNAIVTVDKNLTVIPSLARSTARARSCRKAIATQTTEVFGAKATVGWEVGYPSMVNHETETDYAAEAARRVAADVNTKAPAIMGGEDFAYMLEACPGAYIQVGNGDSADVHHPKYNFNDAAIPVGASY